MSDRLDVFLDDGSAAVVTYGPVVVIVWRALYSTAPMDAADAAVAALTARYGEGRKLFYVHRVPSIGNIVGMHPNLHAMALQHFERHDRHFAAAAIAIESDGFGGAFLRSVAASVIMMRRSVMTTESFADTSAAVRWLGTQAQPTAPFDAEAMVEALNALELAWNNKQKISST